MALSPWTLQNGLNMCCTPWHTKLESPVMSLPKAAKWCPPAGNKGAGSLAVYRHRPPFGHTPSTWRFFRGMEFRGMEGTALSRAECGMGSNYTQD